MAIMTPNDVNKSEKTILAVILLPMTLSATKLVGKVPYNYFQSFVTNGGDIFLNDDDFGNLKSTLDKDQFYHSHGWSDRTK